MTQSCVSRRTARGVLGAGPDPAALRAAARTAAAQAEAALRG